MTSAHSIGASDLSEYFGLFPPQYCWRAAKYLGSMLVLDFGNRVPVDSVSGIDEGALKLGVRNVKWRAMLHEEILCEAETIGEGDFEREFASRVIGSAIVQVSMPSSDQWIRFEFDNGLALEVDSENTWASNGDLLEIVFPNGTYVVLDEAGKLEVLAEIEPVRAAQ